MENQQKEILNKIESANKNIHNMFADKLRVNTDLDRTLVSFQANKNQNGYRWYKYKEGFSADLIKYVFEKLNLNEGRILDPFAGSGAALFTISELGIDSVGIELLPSSSEIIEVRHILKNEDTGALCNRLRQFREKMLWLQPGPLKRFNHLKITEGAFPRETEQQLERYLFEIDQMADESLKRVLFFAAMCILEDVSYTRKDGQYLRWDSRSNRRLGGKPFCKGIIKQFTQAICSKLDQIVDDLAGNDLQLPLYCEDTRCGQIELLKGSCLELLPKMESQTLDGIITSPPYCNRYDYTRTYALELAMVGVDEDKIRELRQAMLSCTVENREKNNLGRAIEQEQLSKAVRAFEEQELLQLILKYLDRCRKDGQLNNNGVPRMVRNYFKELAIVIFECARVLKPGAPFIMVNDNVRYQGVIIPVDLILSQIAQKAGLDIDAIWVLPIGKGNSSQQMKKHGREEMRKCVYIWKRQQDISHVAKSDNCKESVRLAA